MEPLYTKREFVDAMKAVLGDSFKISTQETVRNLTIPLEAAVLRAFTYGSDVKVADILRWAYKSTLENQTIKFKEAIVLTMEQRSKLADMIDARRGVSVSGHHRDDARDHRVLAHHGFLTIFTYANGDHYEVTDAGHQFHDANPFD
jgi:hypothetical protein